MGTTTRLILATFVVVLAILAWAAAQGIGEAFGHGIREYLP